MNHLYNLRLDRSMNGKAKLSGLIALFALLLQALILPGQQDHTRAYEMLRERGEIYFSFPADDENVRGNREVLQQLLSIDRADDREIRAYANQRTFQIFAGMQIDYALLTPPSMLHDPLMRGPETWRGMDDWDYYPTYEAYVDIMNQFAEDYPDLCEVVSIATLDSDREILVLHINDSLGIEQAEPEFLYTATIHGDETAGYVVSLHLIDYLLSNFGTDDYITELVKNIDIWINPLSNPDGTYAGGNSTVFGAKRFNANNVDLNRNYPDPEDGTNPDGNAHQPETLAFMDFAEDHNFVMSANFHGGTEVCNYPWDTWSERHADDDWWIYVCRQYADTVHKYAPSGYFTDLNNGITNGYDWYTISGGRQDYMTYFEHGREFTLEMSDQKLVPASTLPDFWEYNYRSLLRYMEQVMYGIAGVVTDSKTGGAVAAEITLEDHDKDESQVYASGDLGDYYRPVKAGNYTVTFSHPGYQSKTFNDIEVSDMELTQLNVMLDPIETFVMTDTVAYVCEATFFDPGGPDANYEDQDDRVMTFISYLESGKLQLTFEDFELENSAGCENDFLEIFDGVDTTAALLGRWCGTDDPGTITTTNVDGALTFRFHSDEAVNHPGWKAILTCDTGVGLRENEPVSFALYPNPAATHTNLDLNDAVEEVSILDISGNILQVIKPVSGKLKIDISHLNPGIYLVRIQQGHHNTYKRLIKN
ncbi:MAG: M14 family zinc carboxypeptidase [bacterium]